MPDTKRQNFDELVKAISTFEVAGTVVADGTLHIFAIPDQVIARITAEPKLPKIPINLRVSPGFSLSGEIQYSAVIEYKEHGRNDASHGASGRSGSLGFTVDFGDIIQGGTFTLEMVVPLRRDSDGATGNLRVTGTSSVRGDNPTKADVRSRLGELPLQVTAYRESRLRQFDASGLPLFGPPNGFGVMQLDTPPATARQLWDWRQNVDAGVALFRQKANEARTYPGRVRNNYPDATDFTPEQLKLETYQRYNGGGYWQWDDANKRWVVKPNNGYADESLRIEKSVADGNPPPDWNQ